MLMVSDLLELARSGADPDELAARAPARFAPSTRRAPVVVWNVCRHCNQTCPHCYASASRKPSPQDLSSEEAHRLIDELADSGVRFLIFSGGEPLLRADLFELVAHATTKGIAAQLSTNGVLLDEMSAKRLAAAGCRYVGISIDGRAELNDPYRGLPGSFARASAGLVHAREAGMKTGLRVTVTRRNVGEVGPLIEHAKSLGVSRFYVSHLVYAGRGRRLVAEDVSRGEARALLFGLFETADQLLSDPAAPRIVTGGNDSDGALLVLWLERHVGRGAAGRVRRALERRGGNSAGEGVLNIDDRGRVHPDQFWQEATLGDVREQPFAEILAHPLITALRDRSTRVGGRCSSCPFLSICRGSHRERALAAYGDLWGPDPACVLTDNDLIGAARVVGGTA